MINIIISELSTKLKQAIDNSKEHDIKERYALMQEFFNTEIIAVLKHFQQETIQNEFNDQLYAA